MTLTGSAGWDGRFHFRKEVAPLKHDLGDADSEEPQGSFHFQKEVAPLKPPDAAATLRRAYGFHRRKEVAPLKRRGLQLALR